MHQAVYKNPHTGGNGYFPRRQFCKCFESLGGHLFDIELVSSIITMPYKHIRFVCLCLGALSNATSNVISGRILSSDTVHFIVLPHWDNLVTAP